MWLSLTDANGKEVPLFDVIVPIFFGMQSGSAVVTYRNDNNEATILIRKIPRLCVFLVIGHRF
jgi:hypothetical protein